RAETALRWRRDLIAVVPDRIVVLSREEALAEGGMATGEGADVFVIDTDLGRAGGGLRLMSELRSRAPTRHAAICIVHPEGAVDSAAMAYDLGADEQVHTGIDPREMGVRLRGLLRRKRAADRLRASVQDGLRLAVIDPLTGLYNRRYAIPQLAVIAGHAQQNGAGFAVMVIDLDRFKAVNDRWGHAAGDAVLAEVARRLSDNLRSDDLLARIGGEEFLVALLTTGLPQARATADRLREAVQERPFALPCGASLLVTVSIGLAICDRGCPRRSEPVAEVVDRADRALLAAKSNGRNMVTISRSAA
ncbi:MAG TPA: diguanylate cyclase, partial [Paracoccaceae bacterium]